MAASITIKVKTLKEAAVELSVTGATTVGGLKALIEQSPLKVPAAMQRLIYQGKVLKEEERDLASFGVGEGSCLLLSDLSKVMGAAAATTAATSGAATTTPSIPTAAPTAPTAAQPAAMPTGPLPAHVVILRAAIQGVRTSNPPEVAATALRTLQTIIGNVVTNPHEAKYRQVKRSNATFDRKVGAVNGTGAILRAAGFAESPDAWELAASEQGWLVITSAKAELDAAVAALPPPAGTPGAPPGGMPGMGMGMGMGMGGGAPNPFGAMGGASGGMGGMMGGGGGGMPGMGDMAGMMQLMQSNPAMRQQVLAQLRATRPEMAAQAEALLANPGMLQGAVQAMQQNPALMQQAMAMAGQQGGMGGMPPAMPGFGAAPGAAQQPGQPGQAPPGQNDAQMTEEEMIQEAINRSLQEM